MFEKINIWCVIKDHLQTLKNDNTDKPDWKDYCLFLILPIISPTVLCILKLFLSDTLINVAITALAIFVGLLLNVMVMIFDIIKTSNDEQKSRLIKETYSNISFAILLSIISIIPLVGCYIDVPPNASKLIEYCHFVANAISYYLLTLFFITLLMILKRVHVILSEEMKENKPEK